MKARKGLALALAVLAVSCTTKNDASVELYAVCGPPDDAAKCSTSGTCETLLAGRPWVATRTSLSRVQNEFRMFTQVNNQMPNNEDPEKGKANTNDFVIEEFQLRYSSFPGLSIPDFTYPQNQLVPAGGSATPIITFIPPQVMKVIDDANFAPMYAGSLAPNLRVDVEVRAAGHTRDGRGVTTEAWVVPIDVYDVDRVNSGTPPVSFDAVCVTTSGTRPASAVCPNNGQTASVECD